MIYRNFFFILCLLLYCPRIAPLRETSSANSFLYNIFFLHYCSRDLLLHLTSHWCHHTVLLISLLLIWSHSHCACCACSAVLLIFRGCMYYIVYFSMSLIYDIYTFSLLKPALHVLLIYKPLLALKVSLPFLCLLFTLLTTLLLFFWSITSIVVTLLFYNLLVLWHRGNSLGHFFSPFIMS